MTKAELLERVRVAIDRRGAEIIELGEAIRRQPELRGEVLSPGRR